VEVTHLNLSTMDPANLSSSEKLRLVNESEGMLVEILAGETVFGSLHLQDSDIDALPEDMTIEGSLYLENMPNLRHLPESLQVEGGIYLHKMANFTHLPDTGSETYSLRKCPAFKCFPDISNKKLKTLSFVECGSVEWLPDDLTVGFFLLKGNYVLDTIPARTEYNGWVDIRETVITHIPEGCKFRNGIDLGHCNKLTELPKGMSVFNSVSIHHCDKLKEIPEGFTVNSGSLGVTECPNLERIPYDVFTGGEIRVYKCPKFEIGDPTQYQDASAGIIVDHRVKYRNGA